MKRLLLLLLLLPILVSAQEATAPSPLTELIGDSGFKQPAPKETSLGEKLDQLLEQLRIKRAELEAEAAEEEEDTGEKLEQATEEVGKALGPITEAINWLSGLPGYWEAFLVGGIALIILFFVYIIPNINLSILLICLQFFLPEISFIYLILYNVNRLP